MGPQIMIPGVQAFPGNINRPLGPGIMYPGVHQGGGNIIINNQPMGPIYQGAGHGYGFHGSASASVTD